MSVLLSSIVYHYFSVAYTQYQALQIACFRHIQQNWMVFRRPTVLDDPQRFVGVLGGVGYHFQEVGWADVERAGAGDESPSGAQHFHGTQVEFLVAAESFIEVALGFGKRRRIENDGVIAPVRSRVLPQQIEGVGLDPFQLPPV